MGRSSSIADLALALFAADGREEVLAAWCAAAEPPADLVALSDPPAARLAVVLRRREGRWDAVAAPPVSLGPLRREPVSRSLAEERLDARDDLLWSLGQREQLVWPLSTGDSGVLVLARAEGSYTIDDLVTLAEPTELLAGALDALGRRQRRAAPRDAAEAPAAAAGQPEHPRQSLLARAERLATAGQLASTLAHEINNPLTTVIGFAQLLRRDPDAGERTTWLAIVEEEAQRCHRLVSELMGVARPGRPRRTPVELASIADRALATMAATMRGQQVVAALQVDPATPPVEVAADEILQVLLNLLTNALHALEGHPGRREIAIEIGPAPEGVRLVVEDTGPGIAPEHLDQIFDPFFTTKPEGKGTGLGLAVVCGVVAEHGGTLDVDSAPGRGARFVLTLPRAAGHAAELPARPAAAAPAALRPPVEEVPVLGPPLLPRLDGLRVLVLDDEPEVGAVLVATLREAGAEARSMADPEAALEWLLERGADVIVSDLRMPRMSGLEFYAQLRRRAPQLADRLLFSTGDPLSAELEGPPPRPVIGKPFHVAEVARLVREVAATATASAFPPPEARPEPRAAWRGVRRPGGPTHH
ncbi:MAG: ATP-binding protein [Acidobacteria bacterium]|jgi:signal transduction histidine kinase|nr:ATP-binding protein [Acidobacteriota bacterium]